jgi:CHAT domain-containing protein
VQKISRYFRRATTLTGTEATEEAVKEAAPRASSLHFATHGLLDEREPLLSGIALAQDDDPAEDGILQTYEVLRLDLAADLVVLSACNTGLGRVVGGEGVLGLTRAFLHAGARSLVISLWEVSDRSTPELMDDFYRARFKERLPTDRALRAAKLAAIARGVSPREWAGFCLVGEAGAERTPPPGRAMFMALSLVLMVTAAGAYVLARRRGGGSSLTGR